jgi:formate dehydrogenase iron-sulfur subunit
MHCQKPSCESVCPVGALEKTDEGPVVYHEERCIGCRYCMVACPFGIPKYEWDKTLPRVQKCILCAPRLAEGEIPACAEICPTEATVFGEREELLREAHRRLLDNPDAYVGRVYGEHEVGGTSVLFLADVNYAQLGFPTALSDEPLPELTWRALRLVPNVVSLGGAFLFGLWWIINRRMDAQREAVRAERVGDQ